MVVPITRVTLILALGSHVVVSILASVATEVPDAVVKPVLDVVLRHCPCNGPGARKAFMEASNQKKAGATA